MADQLDAITQPLQRRTGNKDAALHRVGDLAIQTVGHRGQQAVVRAHGLRPGVLHHEAAGAIGAFDHARLEAGLTDQRGLLVASHTHDRYGRTQPVSFTDPEVTGAIADLRQQAARDVEQFEQLLIPLLAMDVEQQGARSITGIGTVHLATGQAPQQEAVHGTEAQLATRRTLAGTGHLIEQPAQFAGGEIGIDQQAGTLTDPGFVSVGLELRAIVGGTPVLPDDRRVDRHPCLRIPHQGRFALIGDTDGRHLAGAQSTVGQRLATDLEGAQPELLAVMLDPAIAGEILFELLLRTGHRQPLGAEQDGPAARRTLIDSQ